MYPDSEGRLFGSLEEAYNLGDAWLGYMWGPTKIASELDLTRLEEPPYSESCWDAHKGCAYPTSRVRIVVHPSLTAAAPEVMEFLRKWDLDTNTQIAIEDHFTTTDQDYEETAIWFLRNLEIIWVRWVPPEVFETVKKAVADK